MCCKFITAIHPYQVHNTKLILRYVTKYCMEAISPVLHDVTLEKCATVHKAQLFISRLGLPPSFLFSISNPTQNWNGKDGEGRCPNWCVGVCEISSWKLPPFQKLTAPVITDMPDSDSEPTSGSHLATEAEPSVGDNIVKVIQKWVMLRSANFCQR